MKRLSWSPVAVDLRERDKGVQGRGRSDEERRPGRTSCDTSRTCKSLEAVRGESSNKNWKQHLALAENPEGSNTQLENK